MSLDPPGQGMPDDLQRTHSFDLGILLVHGIGQQGRGDTLEANGGALVNSIRHYVKGWLGDDLRATVTVERASVSDSDGPEHFVAEIVFEQTAGDDKPLSVPNRRRWLVAESHWADAFTPPAYSDISDWVWRVLPVVVVFHFDRRVRRAHYEINNPDNMSNKVRRWWRLFLRVAFSVAAAIVLPPLMVLMIGLLALGLLPLPFVKEPVRLAQRLLAASVGDSYVLLERTVGAARIRERVRTDMAWLGERCERTAMVAHSQGGAVAHQVALDNPRMPCDLLVTYGSGLRKLALLKRHLRAPRMSDRHALRAGITALFTAWLVPLAWLASASPSAPPSLAAMWVVASPFLVIGMGLVSRWARRSHAGSDRTLQAAFDRRLYAEQFELVNQNTRWVDVYSSHDPVSNGPLLDEYRPSSLSSYEVALRGSMLFDHTSYWRAHDSFVLPLTRLLFQQDLGAPQEDNAVPSHQVAPRIRGEAAWVRRRWRVAWTTLASLAVAGSAMLVFSALMATPPAGYLKLAAAVAGHIRAVPWVGPAIVGTQLSPHTTIVALGSTAAFAAACAALLMWIWTRWDQREAADAVSGPRPAEPSPLPWALVGYILTAVAVLAVGLFLSFGAAPALFLAIVVTAGIVTLQLSLRNEQVRDVVNWQTVSGSPTQLDARADEVRAAAAQRMGDSEHRLALYREGCWLVRSSDAERQNEGLRLLELSVGKGLAGAGYVLGDFLEQQRGCHEEAAAAFDKAAKLGDHFALARRANLMITRLDQVEPGEQLLEEAVRRNDDEYACYQLALSLDRRGERAGALATVRRFLCGGVAREPRRISRYCADWLADRAETHDERVRALALSVDSGRLGNAVMLAGAHARHNEPAEATRVLRDGMALGCLACARRLGEVLSRNGQDSKAAWVQLRALELAERHAVRRPGLAPGRSRTAAPAHAYDHGAQAAAGLAEALAQAGQTAAASRIGARGYALAEGAADAHPDHRSEPLQRLALRHAQQQSRRRNRLAAFEVAAGCGSVTAALELAGAYRFRDLSLAERWARRAVALETEQLRGSDDAPAHRMLSRLLERHRPRKLEFLALLRIAAGAGDLVAAKALTGWLSRAWRELDGAFPNLDALVAEVRADWRDADARFDFVEQLIDDWATQERLWAAGFILMETRCRNDAANARRLQLETRLARRFRTLAAPPT